MKRVIVHVCTVVAVVAAATTGCAQDSGRASAPPPRELTQAERLRISDATEVLIKQCMNRAGFSYWTGPRLSLEESRPLDYVNDDVDWAREHGYGSRIRDKEDRARRANPNGTYRAGLSAPRRKAYDEALDGGLGATILTTEIPTGAGKGSVHKRWGGCSAEAGEKLYGDPVAWFRADKAVTNLQPLYVPRITRDRTFTEALAAWSRCMTRAGHVYPDPPAAQDAVAGNASGRSPGEAFEVETRVAVAEARCAHETSFATIARERQAYYVGTLPDRYTELIGTHRRLQRDAFARAAEVTGPRV
ncbi:hypothetical protein OG462_26805 [Streptomyces sp. NBC_01077]|uniref:hypothetical protein n=1 Tax=Streptomyces sp. NBC_01077 TaxID=2903746 RepID=UPI00387009E0|nr:hypothetical protein OG462_26805 [Streptomyces sp. NBC_01077]